MNPYPSHSRGRRLASALAAVLAFLAAGPGQAAEMLRIGGTGNALGAMQRVGEAFAKRNPGVTVKVLPSLGTSGAVKAVPQGAIEVGLSSRALRDEESRLGVTQFEYARTPFVIAVPRKSPATAITRDDLADFFAGRKPAWPDGTPVRPILRQPGDDNTRQLRQMSPAIDAALTLAEKRPGLPFATTDQEAADKGESVPGALVLTTLGLILSEGRALKPLVLDGVEPTVANAASGRYPHVKRFFLVTRATPSEVTKRFVDFVRSPEGREILAGSGHWVP